MSEVLAALVCLGGGFVGGIVGVGGGILFVPAMVVFLDFSQVEAESTSLLMIVFVALVGTHRPRSYGTVNLRDASGARLTNRQSLGAIFDDEPFVSIDSGVSSRLINAVSPCGLSL